jgi:Fe-S oxidoreductase
MKIVQDIYDKCIECKLCVKECAFLKRYGTPKQIAETILDNSVDLNIAYECSLCNLCLAVCPVKINPGAMMLAMRRIAVARGHEDFSRQQVLINYEKRGTSKLFSWYGLPEGCQTVLFPGCSVSGSRADRVVQLFKYLRKSEPTLGVVLDCCTKPSHDLGRQEYFYSMFNRMKERLTDHGVKKVLTACPSCYRIFKEYGSPLEVQSVYELLEHGEHAARNISPVTVHDPCSGRFDEGPQDAVRSLISAMGIPVEEMKYQRKKTICCGEGGAAGYIDPSMATGWTDRRAEEAAGRHIITYCAGCTSFLGKKCRADHLLDLYFDPQTTLAGKASVTKSPFTYLKRLLLKQKLKKLV